MKVFSLFLVLFMFITNITPSMAYAKEVAKDYKFTYEYEFQNELKDRLLLYPDNKINVIDPETNQSITLRDYNKKYKKKYTEVSKQTEPKQPKQPEEAKSILKKSTVKKFNELAKDQGYIQYIIEEKKKNIEGYNDYFYEKELGLYLSWGNTGADLTNYKELKKGNQKVIKYLEEKTGIKTNEKYFEELIKNTLQYVNDKINTQLHNKNNPHKELIKKYSEFGFRPESDKERMEQAAFCHWLMYGGKYKPTLFKNKDLYDVKGDRYTEWLFMWKYPYLNLLTYAATDRRNSKVEILSISTAEGVYEVIETNSEEDPDYINEIIVATSILDPKVRDRDINANKEAIVKHIKKNKDTLYQNTDVVCGEDLFAIACLIGDVYFDVTFVYQDGKFKICDIHDRRPFIFRFG